MGNIQKRSKVSNVIYLGLIAVLLLLIVLFLSTELKSTKLSDQTPKPITASSASPSSFPASSGASTLSANSGASSGSDVASINVNGQQTTINGPTNYSQTYTSNGATTNVSVSNQSSHSGNSASSQSSSSISVNTNN